MKDTAEALQPLVGFGPDVQPVYPSLRITGFTDVNYHVSNLGSPKSGFNAGQFALHFASALSPRVSFFAELTITEGDEVGVANLERYILRYDQSDYFKISVGRYHTQINWWNTAFHHGLWLQTSVGKPEIIKYHGGFLPPHFVGGIIEGRFPAGGLNIGYNAGAGNGRAKELFDPGDAGDVNNNRAWLIHLFSRPDGVPGLEAGASVYHDRVPSADGLLELEEWITSGYIVLQQETPEVIAEIANVNHRNEGTGLTADNLAWYLQVAYRLPWCGEMLKPYFRFESVDISSSDAVFTGIHDLRRALGGVRFDFSDFAAVKAEFRHDKRPGLADLNAFYLQTCLTF